MSTHFLTSSLPQLHACHVLTLHICTCDCLHNILPVAAINRLSTAANKHKATAKNEQNRKAAERGAGSEAEICQPDAAQRVCEELIAYAESWLDRLTTGGDKYLPEELLPCITVQPGAVAVIAAVLNAVTISSTMARKYAIVNARVGDIQVSQHVSSLLSVAVRQCGSVAHTSSLPHFLTSTFLAVWQ